MWSPKPLSLQFEGAAMNEVLNRNLVGPLIMLLLVCPILWDGLNVRPPGYCLPKSKCDAERLQKSTDVRSIRGTWEL